MVRLFRLLPFFPRTCIPQISPLGSCLIFVDWSTVLAFIFLWGSSESLAVTHAPPVKFTWGGGAFHGGKLQATEPIVMQPKCSTCPQVPHGCAWHLWNLLVPLWLALIFIGEQSCYSLFNCQDHGVSGRRNLKGHLAHTYSFLSDPLPS